MELADLLEAGHDYWASAAREAAQANGKTMDDFLISNELWGGAGSIADQALIVDANRRRVLERLLVELGRIQLANERTNPRTEMWVRAFAKWAPLK